MPLPPNVLAGGALDIGAGKSDEGTFEVLPLLPGFATGFTGGAKVAVGAVRGFPSSVNDGTGGGALDEGTGDALDDGAALGAGGTSG